MFDFYTETLTWSVSSLTVQYIIVRKVILLLFFVALISDKNTREKKVELIFG